MPVSQTGRPVVIIGPPPTPNGDLHVGHMAGPYLAADVHARYLRATGRPVIYATGTDDSQTYVVATARRQGRTPTELCATSSEAIQRTLGLMGISVDGFAPFDAGYQQTVLDFVTTLHRAGKFRVRTVQLPFSERSGEFLMEGLVCGDCPVCLSQSRGALCETCGHPIDFAGLLAPGSTMDPTDRLSLREARVLVLPMEEYRAPLTAFYERQARTWRPHMLQLIREVLARPLPDFPITYPTTWGIPAPFPETPGQVLNAWVEGMPASIYCTAFASARQSGCWGPVDELWRAERETELVYFLGFDNAYFWGMTHLALLLAHGERYVVPSTIVCNEFYELENEKFSTSRGHVVWTADLLAEVPRDVVRFYLALTAPEHQRTNFSRAALDKVTGQRLVGPWNRLARTINGLLAETPQPIDVLPVSAEGRARAVTLIGRFGGCYELAGYSLTRAADLIAIQVERLLRRALALESAGQHASLAELGDLFVETTALLSGAGPILIDLAARATASGRFDGCLSESAFAERATVRPFALPSLESIQPVQPLERVREAVA